MLCNVVTKTSFSLEESIISNAFGATVIAGIEGSELGFHRGTLETQTHKTKNIQVMFAVGEEACPRNISLKV